MRERGHLIGMVFLFPLRIDDLHATLLSLLISSMLHQQIHVLYSVGLSLPQ